MVFESKQIKLESNRFEIVSKDQNRHFGGFFINTEEQK
jgi:hypothetical protein